MILILIEKIISLFFIMLLGVLLVKSRILNAQDSRILSALCIYLIMPCVILEAFQVNYTEEIRNGLMLAVVAALLIHILWLGLVQIAGFLFHLDAVEKTSVMYSNAGNLIIPLVTAMLGQEWVIYSSAFVSVQLFWMWSHGKMVLCGEKKIEVRKVITNINMIAVFAGIILFIFQIHFPKPLDDALSSVGQMVGPVAMLVTGMLIGNMNLKGILGYKRIWLTTFLRLIVFPAAALLLLKFSGMASFAKEGKEILLISLLATMTPSASSITQMAQIYGKDADYASAINVVTTLLCVVTMPVMTTLYQM